MMHAALVKDEVARIEEKMMTKRIGLGMPFSRQGVKGVWDDEVWQTSLLE